MALNKRSDVQEWNGRENHCCRSTAERRLIIMLTHRAGDATRHAPRVAFSPGSTSRPPADAPAIVMYIPSSTHGGTQVPNRSRKTYPAVTAEDRGRLPPSTRCFSAHLLLGWRVGVPHTFVYGDQRVCPLAGRASQRICGFRPLEVTVRP